jgi:hypothetical protein
MRKTTVQLTDEQYFYLKEKALALQKKNQGTSMVSLIRELIDEDMKLSREGRAKPIESRKS